SRMACVGMIKTEHGSSYMSVPVALLHCMSLTNTSTTAHWEEGPQSMKSKYSTLDNSEDGMVAFHEYVTAIGMLIQGSSVEKLCWSYKLYDEDKDRHQRRC
ncbi:hypothetical protein P4O66_018211, partial [Electrophorus voltai]